MPTPSSGRESRRSSKSGAGANEAYKSSDRRENSKSSQIYDAHRRGSRQAESSLGSASARPQLKTRQNSAPLIDTRGGDPGSRHDVGDGKQTGKEGKSASTPKIGSQDAQDEDEVAGVVGAVRHFEPFQSPEISDPVPDVNIVVLGAKGVGKSTFVQKALDLPHPPRSRAVERKITVRGSDYTVRLLELPIEDIDIDDDDTTVNWPDTIEDKMMPHIDGALALYDIKDEGSLENIPEMLSAIHKAGIPLALISCKCDARPEEAKVDPLDVEQRARRSIKHLNTLQTSTSTPETHKRADQMRSSSATRRRAQSNAVRPVSPRPPSDRGHARAASEFTGSQYKDQRHSRHDSSNPGCGSNDRLKVPHETTHEEMHGSFLIEESASDGSIESSRSSTDVANYAGTGLLLQPTSTLSENGATFEQLIDRLLAQPTSKADSKFAAIFLALYRKFAAPGQLLEAIVERFEALDRNGSALLMKTATQLRYIAILEQWVGTYPGDFAYPKTKQRMRTLVGKLSQERIFSVASKEMNSELDAIREDDDTNWAFNDKDRACDAIRISLSSAASTLIDDPTFLMTDGFSLGGSTLLDETSPVTPPGGDPARSLSTASTPSQLIVNVEAAQRQAQLLAPIPRQPVTKIQWRQLMEYPDDIVARELTRMDWIMFSSVRPRDLVRQVSLTKEQQANCKNLSHVNRMIDHFNQLAFWVENFILLRDKPKHRALMLEKFMRIARKLREINNYNALGAIIAGVKSSAVHRLGATRELIPPNVGKDWMKLEILLAPSRSHFAYRLAWENSSSERIPYLPLHRRDLVSAEEGNKTFIGEEKDGRINWKKFEIMGEVIVSMQKAQGMPYKGLGGGGGNQQIKELVLDGKLTKDEDDLFKRSKQVEPTGSTAGATSTKLKEFFKR